MGEGVHAEQHAVSSGPLGLIFLILAVLGGCTFIYAFVLLGDATAVEVGLVILLLALFCSLGYAAIINNDAEAVAAGAIALASAVAIVAILLPSTGSAYIDAVILFSITAAASVIFIRIVRLPELATIRLGQLSVLIVLGLPIGLAFIEALFLGFRFRENFPFGTPSFFFIPFIAMFGYVEEALFRGIVQRSLTPVAGTSAAIVFAALLNASFMMFWGSIMFVIFSFAVSLLFGYLYARSLSLMYVGTVHALMDTWLVIAFLLLGMGGS
jgi:membrane protease YdiL (CAAX protease family)